MLLFRPSFWSIKITRSHRTHQSSHLNSSEPSILLDNALSHQPFCCCCSSKEFPQSFFLLIPYIVTSVPWTPYLPLLLTAPGPWPLIHSVPPPRQNHPVLLPWKGRVILLSLKKNFQSSFLSIPFRVYWSCFQLPPLKYLVGEEMGGNHSCLLISQVCLGTPGIRCCI